jgi:hypothetical protein
MKRMLALISTVGIFTTFTTGILVSVPKSASAYCVHNLTGTTIRGWDKNGEWNVWMKTLAPDQRDCCPGKNEECQNATLEIFTEEIYNSKGRGGCTIDVGPHQLVEVRYHNHQMHCMVRD